MPADKDKKDKKEYDIESIKVLRGLEGVRQRPSMYIGSTGKSGLHHLVYEVVDNSCDEALAGFCTEIKIKLQADGSVYIEDNGRGIPVEKHPQLKKSGLEIVTTMLHAGGKFDNKAYLISGGLHGVGVSVVNALSKWMTVRVRRGGKIYEQKYEKGNPMGPVKVIGTYTSGGSGTIVIFKPDAEIFSVLAFDFELLTARLRELAFLNPALTIVLEDGKAGKKEKFHAAGGLIEFIRWLNRNRKALHKPIYFKKTVGSTVIEVVIQYNDSYYENIFGFVNTINTVEGGTHITGFKTAVTRVINDYVAKSRMKNVFKVEGNDVREGLTAIINVNLREPQFEGQTKTKLGNSEVKGIADSAVSQGVAQFFEENPGVAKVVVTKALEAAKARKAAKKAKELVRRKSVLTSTALPGKLADCSSKKLELTELYIVEGESAGGCFSEDTMIALADGRNVSFKDLVGENTKGKENFCYTINKNGSITKAKIENPRLTKKNVQVIKIILDNNEKIICTSDHKFMLRNGNYKEAKDITKEDFLMPFHFEKMLETVNNYNHKIKKIEELSEKIDVYDLEVEETHNFALASGIFVHNSAKQARDKETQAILPLKGKILNVEKANTHKIFSSEEILILTTALGTGMGEHFNPDKLRYGKIIIMCDADVDGHHIETLLLTFLFRFAPNLIEQGRVFIAMPPLYKIRKGSQDNYVYSDKQLENLLKKMSGSPNVQRFKGLGEMNPQQLWQTTMNPKTRILKRVTIADAVEADQIFSILMGSAVEPRKNFIVKHAQEAILDV